MPGTSGIHNGGDLDDKDYSSWWYYRLKYYQVEITGSANIYRTKFTSGGSSSDYQTYFAPEAGATKAKTVKIKVAINKVTGPNWALND